MECIIIAIPGKETSEKIAGLIRRRGLEAETCICASTSAVLREAGERDSGIVICAETIKDMAYAELFDYLPVGYEMVILTKNPDIALFHERIRVLMMPFRAAELLDLISDRLNQIRSTRKKQKKVHIKRTPEEQQVIDNAKALLMKQHGISEPEAHRMIQKESMDYGRSFVESAQMILLLNSEW